MKKFIRSLCLVAVLCANAAPLRAEDLTLAEAIRSALAQNPELQAARQRIEAATGRAVQARLWPNPELEFSAEDVPVDAGGLSQAKNLVELSQTVPFPGKKSLDTKIGRKGVSVAESEYLRHEIELVRDVKSAFYRALAADRKVSVSEELTALAESLAEAAGKRVAAGAATDQEKLRAEIEWERANVELTATQRERVEAQKNLATLMGRPREPLGSLRGELRETISDPALEQVREQTVARHPNVRTALANRERAELELRRAKLDPLPDVTFGLAGGRDGAFDESLMEFHLTLPLPLFDRAQGRTRVARAEAEVAKYDLTATEQKLVEQLGVVDARLRAASEQVEAYRARILPKAEEALRLVRGGFDAGKFGFLDLVDTQRTVAETRLAYLEKLLELNLAIADWEALAATPSKE